MGKFFVLTACLGTALIITGCQGPKPGKARKDIQTITGPVRADLDQTRASAEISIELVADVQDTNVVNAQCKGKDVLTEKRVYEASAPLTITGVLASAQFTSVEVESKRTQTKLESSKISANGDIQFVVSNSARQNESRMLVMEGSNLLKMKYLNCVETSEVANEDGTFTKKCVKNDVVVENEVVLNVVIKQNVIEGVRTEDGCPATAEETVKPSTDGQE